MSVRTVFMGSDPISLPLLESLPAILPEIRLAGVFTQPDRPHGRGQKQQANAIKRWALEQELPVRQPERCGPADESWIRSERVELILVMAYGQILKPSLLGIPPLGVFNFHASLLPRLRGASPIHTAIATGERETGVSLMRVTPPLDAGPFSDQEVIPIGPETDAPRLIEQISAACLPLAKRALPAVVNGKAPFQEQDPAQVTFCRRIFKEDAQLDFHAPAKTLERRIRAFQPWPGALFHYGQTPIRIGAARVIEAIGSTPGTFELTPEGQCRVACGEGALQLERLQRPGGRMLPSSEFLRGFRIESGNQAQSLPMAPLVASKPFPWRWRPGDPFEAAIAP